MLNKFAILLLVAGSFSISQAEEENTCSAVTECISKRLESRKFSRQGRWADKLRERDSLGKCGNDKAKQMADALEQHKELKAERFKRVVECIEGKNDETHGFKGCDLPSGDISRSCIPRKFWKTNKRNNERWQERMEKKAERRAKKNNRKCKKDICGCPEAKLCHQCYEVSGLHDEIHGLQLLKQKLKLECGIPQVEEAEDDEIEPEDDEELFEALTS